MYKAVQIHGQYPLPDLDPLPLFRLISTVDPPSACQVVSKLEKHQTSIVARQT